MTAGLTAVPLATAAPAQATQRQCVNYLASKNYEIGDVVYYACRQSGVFKPLCISTLIARDVSNAHAIAACNRA
ncbi:hypothetical protein ABZX40_37910 [Streptomyces sp. NPDC004610]|uniref:hypothetical protein n=1 Tax=unclassified Streptomyces TaxID=2593676 RepID=UPI0033BD5096